MPPGKQLSSTASETRSSTQSQFSMSTDEFFKLHKNNNIIIIIIIFIMIIITTTKIKYH